MIVSPNCMTKILVFEEISLVRGIHMKRNKISQRKGRAILLPLNKIELFHEWSQAGSHGSFKENAETR